MFASFSPKPLVVCPYKDVRSKRATEGGGASSRRDAQMQGRHYEGPPLTDEEGVGSKTHTRAMLAEEYFQVF